MIQQKLKLILEVESVEISSNGTLFNLKNTLETDYCGTLELSNCQVEKHAFQLMN